MEEEHQRTWAVIGIDCRHLHVMLDLECLAELEGLDKLRGHVQHVGDECCGDGRAIDGAGRKGPIEADRVVRMEMAKKIVLEEQAARSTGMSER